MARADLIVLQPGSSSPGVVWQFDAATGTALGTMGYENEGYSALSAPGGDEVLVTSNILGTYDLYRFTRTGTYLGAAASAIYGDFRGAMRGADGSLYCLMRSGAWGAVAPPLFVARIDRPAGTTLVANGTAGMDNPSWLTMGPDQQLYVAERDHGILRFDRATGASLGVFVPTGRGGLRQPNRMVFGPDGRLYVSTGVDNSVLRYEGGTGAFVDAFVAPGSGGMNDAQGLAFGPDGHLYVASRNTNQVLRFNGVTGAFMNVFVSDSRLRAPTDLAFTQGSSSDSVWWDDAAPSGASVGGLGWEWTVTNPAPYSGSLALRSPRASGIQSYAFNFASQPMTVAAGDSLFVYAYLETSTNTEIMLSWCDGSTWEHRAYWGSDVVNEGQNGTPSRRFMGGFTHYGDGWQRLEVPARLVGLEGRTVSGMAVSVSGLVLIDKVGKAVAGPTPPGGPDTIPPTVRITAPADGATVSGFVSIAAEASDNSGTVNVAFQIDGTASSSFVDTTKLSNGPHVFRAIATDVAGNSSQASITVNVNNEPPAGPQVVWFDDNLPAGAVLMTNNDDWTWITSGPSPQSGTRAHQSRLASGLHEHAFDWAYGGALNVTTADRLFTYVYLDPVTPPREIMLSFRNADNWEHRVYWGEDLIGYGYNGTNSRWRLGNLPTAGSWVRLEIPVNAIFSQNTTLYGMSFSLFDGRATWDVTGKSGLSSGDTQPPTVVLTAPANNAVVSGNVTVSATANDNVGVASVALRVDTTTIATITSPPYASSWNSSTVANGSHSLSAIARDGAGNQSTASVVISVNNSGSTGAVTWMDSGVPAGAVTGSSGGDAWTWVTSNPVPFAGTRVHQAAIASGMHDHFFVGASSPFAIFSGDIIFVYVYIDPANAPSEIMLSFNDGTWEHRAYWGANTITYGEDGTSSRRNMGALPTPGQWVQLQIPAAQLGLEGRSINGVSFTLVAGRATWDILGKVRL